MTGLYLISIYKYIIIYIQIYGYINIYICVCVCVSHILHLPYFILFYFLNLFFGLETGFSTEDSKYLEHDRNMTCEESGPWICTGSCRSIWMGTSEQEMSPLCGKCLGFGGCWDRWATLITTVRVTMTDSLSIPRHIELEALGIGSRNLKFLTSSSSDSTHIEVWELFYTLISLKVIHIFQNENFLKLKCSKCFKPVV